MEPCESMTSTSVCFICITSNPAFYSQFVLNKFDSVIIGKKIPCVLIPWSYLIQQRISRIFNGV